jgi:uncharacterized membrane protein YkoI
MKLVLIVSALAIASVGLAAQAKTATYAGHQLVKNAHVDMAQAEATALKARPGKITDKELEKEGGGSGLRYSFDIVSNGVTYEVGVDAKTGRILENKTEGKNPD